MKMEKGNNGMPESIEEIRAYEHTDPKKYFTGMVYWSALSQIYHANLDAAKDIEGVKDALTTQGEFLEWLKAQMPEILNSDGHRAFRKYKASYMRDPKTYAVFLTQCIEHLGQKPIDWAEELGGVNVILCGMADTSKSRFASHVKTYREAIRADAKAKTFAAYQREFAPPDKSESRGRPTAPPTFENLFVDAARALRAAAAVGMISIDNGQIAWLYGGKKGAIVVFWEVMIIKKMVNPDFVSCRMACPIIARHFGTTTGHSICGSMARYMNSLKIELMEKT